jgi:uncharacterized protein YgiM (DUF1202 family)
MKNQRSHRVTRLLVSSLCLLLCLTLLGAAAAETYAVVSDTDSLNLRSDANSSSQWLGAYGRGSWVTVKGSKNNFYYVSTADGKSGYMSKNFLNTTDELAYGDVALVSNSKATAFLNLRSYPSYSASVVTILYNGVPLNILSQDSGWYQVQAGDLNGYLRSEFTTTLHQPLAIAVATIKTPNNTAVNMRVAPSASASVRRQFAGDRYVAVLYKGTYWWYVIIDGYAGFISSDFLAEGLQAERDIAARNEDDDPSADEDGYAIVANPVSTQRLNLRELPSTAADVVARLSNGEKLTMLIQGTEWCKVYVASIAATGYVMTRYLELHGLPTVPKLTIEHPQGSYVNLRSAASMTSQVLVQIPDGATATIIAPGADWVKVKYNGKTGYVMSYFTSIGE